MFSWRFYTFEVFQNGAIPRHPVFFRKILAVLLCDNQTCTDVGVYQFWANASFAHHFNNFCIEVGEVHRTRHVGTRIEED